MFSVIQDVDFKYHLQNLSNSKPVPWLRQVVAGLSPPSHGFDPRSVRARYVMDKVALGQAFLRVGLLLFSLMIVSPILRSHSIYVLLLPEVYNRAKPGNFPRTTLFHKLVSNG